MEVGGKRTIKYQNTSYGIDMQMLRAAPTDFAHAHLDGQLRRVGVLRRQQLRHELVERGGARDHLEDLHRAPQLVDQRQHGHLLQARVLDGGRGNAAKVLGHHVQRTPLVGRESEVPAEEKY